MIHDWIDCEAMEMRRREISRRDSAAWEEKTAGTPRTNRVFRRKLGAALIRWGEFVLSENPAT